MFDIFRIFKSCFSCDTQDDLKRVNFSGKFIYFHDHCVCSVLNSPEQNPKKIAKALMIYDQLRSDVHQHQCQQFLALLSIKDVSKEKVQRVIKNEELAKFKQIFGEDE